MTVTSVNTVRLIDTSPLKMNKNKQKNNLKLTPFNICHKKNQSSWLSSPNK